MRTYTIDELYRRASDREMQQQLTETLMIFDAFCKEHGLRYYLSGGTLLGAVRHQGFIPWDDDIDVNMPRPDCEKLMELSGGWIGNCELMAPNYDDSFHAYHWKLYNDSMLLIKRKGQYFGNKVYPIFVDIFPIDGLPDTEEENVKHYREIFIWKKLLNCLFGGKQWFYGSSLISKLAHGFGRPFAEILGKERLFNKVIGVAKSIPYETADHVGVMMTNVHTTEERVVKAEYEPVVDVMFEGHVLPAPANYDTYLRQLYGDDYMDIPPLGKQVSRHNYVPFFRSKEK